MKKSTILLLVVVYVLSFFVIGLLGSSIKNYNPEIYPESIEVIDPDNKTTAYKDVRDRNGVLLYDYYFVLRNYRNGDNVRLKAIVKPDKCTYPDVIFSKDESDTSFNLITSEKNPNIEQNFVLISLNDILDNDNFVLTAPFLVTSTNPGTAIKLKVGVTIYYYEYVA